jgi:hypothetical protein
MEYCKNRTEEGPLIIIIRRARLQKPTGLFFPLYAPNTILLNIYLHHYTTLIFSSPYIYLCLFIDRFPLQISNAWTGTKLIINEDIPDINDFKKRFTISYK